MINVAFVSITDVLEHLLIIFLLTTFEYNLNNLLSKLFQLLFLNLVALQEQLFIRTTDCPDNLHVPQAVRIIGT